MNNIGSDELLYCISAFGSEEDYAKFISLQLNVDSEIYRHQAIHTAFKYSNIDLITYFLEYMKLYEEAVDDNLLSSMLGFAAEFGYLKIVREIMKNSKCDPTADDNYAIRNAVKIGHLDVVKYLMSLDSKYGIDPAADDNDAILHAAEKGRLHVLKYLMEEVDSKYGIDPAAFDNSAIGCAASGGHLDFVKYLMEAVDSKYGIDPSAGDNWAIRGTSYKGHLNVVKYLASLDSNMALV